MMLLLMITMVMAVMMMMIIVNIIIRVSIIIITRSIHKWAAIVQFFHSATTNMLQNDPDWL